MKKLVGFQIKSQLLPSSMDGRRKGGKNMENLLQKQTTNAFGKTIYLLGADKEGTRYWLEEASFDCDWYWGFGYIETYTNNNQPERSRDINSHEHYDSKILKRGVCPEDFKKILPMTPLTNNEIWKLNELMKSFYIIREYMDTIYRGSTNITNNPCKEIIKNEKEWQRLKDEVLPEIFKEIYKILTPEEKEAE